MSSTTELLVGIDSLSEIVGELDGEPISDDLHATTVRISEAVSALTESLVEAVRLIDEAEALGTGPSSRVALIERARALLVEEAGR